MNRPYLSPSRGLSTVLLLSIVVYSASFTRDNDLNKTLKALPDIVDVVAIPTDSLFNEGYELRIRQPLDHSKPEEGSFLQSVFVSHVAYDRPVLFETEGYAARSGGRPRELASLLKCNQVVVEHRFFGKSKPDSLEWKFLTVEQAAADHHHIYELLKTIYKASWIGSGTSKGGQAALFYRYYFPDDVNVTVAYVAPINLTQEDPRLIAFLRNVGTPEVRERIKEFQVSMLKRENELLPRMDELAREKNLTFSIGKAMAYEYCVLDYPCAFWQYGSSPNSIPPPDAPADTMVAYLDKVSSFFYYADEGIKLVEPFQYQAYTEIGYYGYDITEFKGLLSSVIHPSNRVLAPRNVDLKFNPEPMYNVYSWLRDYGNNIIYLYGETDLWSATAMELSGCTNAIKIVKKGGSHRTRIENLPPAQRRIVYSALQDWLGIRIER